FPAAEDDARANRSRRWREFLLLWRPPRHRSRAAPGDPRLRMTIAEILAGFPKLSALVVGDICLDRWCTYDPATSEPSRETGIPRIGIIRTEVTAGAGGTVANNLATLGVGRVAVMGVTGDDGFGYELAGALRRSGIASNMLVRAPGMQTFTYT